MDLVAQINQIKKRLNDQARVINAAAVEAQEMREVIMHLKALEENNAAMIGELLMALKEKGILDVKEKTGLTCIDGGKA